MYDPAKHAVYSARTQRLMLAMRGVRDEIIRLKEIYTNETASGSHDDFTDTDIATEQEHVDAINAMIAFEAFYASQSTNITPFLQVD